MCKENIEIYYIKHSILNIYLYKKTLKMYANLKTVC